MTNDETIAWDVEEACRAAYPAPREKIVDGWLFRSAGGRVRRINSVNPLRPGGDPSGIIDIAERDYGAMGQAAIFRVPTIVPAMDSPLEQRGYRREGETTTLVRMPGALTPAAAAEVTLTDTPDGAWMAARAGLSDAAAAATAIYEKVVTQITSPAAFAIAKHDNQAAAVAYAVDHNGMLVVESVITAAPLRRRGFAEGVVTALLDWGARRGAVHACLQVEADNMAALALYRKLGFATEIYRYHYRRQHNAATHG